MFNENDITENQLERYDRNIILKDVGVEGQLKILNSKILIIGTGGLGSPALLYLAAAGIGNLGLADYDNVDISNLQRQIIHSTPDIGKPKVISAKEKIEKLNPDVNIKTFNMLINASNIRDLIKEYDFIIDGTDNFAAKFLINDACIMEKKPFSHGGVLRFEGQTITVIPGISTCYRCIFGKMPPKNLVPSCSQAGILGSVAGIVGTIQATEALKFITGAGQLLLNELLVFDAKSFDFRKVKVNMNPDCKICSDHPEITELADEV
jgi:molybdopterin-synthase adenylyltransferase